MATYYPVIVTAAFFIAMIFNDVLKESPELIPINTLQAFVCIGLMIILSYKDAEFVSWGLLTLTVIIIIICYFFGKDKTSTSTSKSSTPSIMSCPTAATGTPSMISQPSSHAMSAEIHGNGNTFTPITSCSR